MMKGLISVLFGLLEGIWGFAKWFVYAFLIVWGIMTLMIIFYLVVAYMKGERFKRRTEKLPTPKYSKPKNILHRLFIQAPRQIANDFINHDPDAFEFYGIHIFAGEQGSGKTMAMIHKLAELKELYPQCKISSNMQIEFADNTIEEWTDILKNNNGTKGQIIVLDEIQNWFNSLESKDIPIEFVAEVCQQRKQRKAIFGTSQVFTRVGKPIREQTTWLYKPFTILGCITVVRVYKPKIKDDGTLDEKNMRMQRCYMFVHDKYLRECYDTYQKIERLSKKGFKPRSEQINVYNDKSVDVSFLKDA